MPSRTGTSSKRFAGKVLGTASYSERVCTGDAIDITITYILDENFILEQSLVNPVLASSTLLQLSEGLFRSFRPGWPLT